MSGDVMPSFTTDGHRNFVSYISGPSHVLLGVEWTEEPGGTPILERLAPLGDCRHGELSEARILAAVTEGIAEANRGCGVAYHPSRILYVANDSPRYDLFRHCATLLVQRRAEGTPFRQVPYSLPTMGISPHGGP